MQPVFGSIQRPSSASPQTLIKSSPEKLAVSEGHASQLCKCTLLNHNRQTFDENTNGQELATHDLCSLQLTLLFSYSHFRLKRYSTSPIVSLPKTVSAFSKYVFDSSVFANLNLSSHSADKLNTGRYGLIACRST